MKDEQPKPTVFFFDGTHGKLIPTVLKAVGLTVRLHMNQGWPADMPDVDWIAECARNDWAIISGDKQIARVPEERKAVVDGRCKVFMFDDGHETRTEDWAAALLVARHRLIEIVEKADGPFFVTIKPCKVHGHFSQPKFEPLSGAGWKPPVAKPIMEKPIEEKPKRGRGNQQAKLVFTQESMALVRYKRISPHCDLCAKLLT